MTSHAICLARERSPPASAVFVSSANCSRPPKNAAIQRSSTHSGTASGEQAETGCGAHGRNIAETPGERPASGLWGRKRFMEMNSLDEEVRRKYQIFTCPGPVNRAVVADAQQQVAMFARQLAKNGLFSHDTASAVTSRDARSLRSDLNFRSAGPVDCGIAPYAQQNIAVLARQLSKQAFFGHNGFRHDQPRCEVRRGGHILNCAGPVDCSIASYARQRITVLARQLAKQAVLGHDTASAMTSPDGSSSPNTFPRSSSASPSSNGRRCWGIERRTRSSVADERSRVESPVTRAIATTASAEPCAFDERFDPARRRSRRDHLVDRAIKELARSQTRQAPQRRLAHFARFDLRQQRIAELCFRLNRQIFQTRRRAPHLAQQTIVQPRRTLVSARQQVRREPLKNIVLLVFVHSSGYAAPEDPPVDLVLDLVGKRETGGVHAARLLDAKIVAGEAESGPQAKATQVEPSHLQRRRLPPRAGQCNHGVG